MRKFIFILMLISLILIPGCGCEQVAEETEDENPVNVLVPDFKGPDSLPHSNGPSGPPPTIEE